MSSHGGQRTLDPGSAARTDWFYTREVVPGVWLLAEPQHVYTWLVEGNDRAVLLDTGMGFLPIRPLAESLTRRPLTVVNTHYHFDHIGGNHEFEEIAIHELGAPLITDGVPREILDLYLGYARRQLEAAESYRQIDSEFFWLLTAESVPRPLPADFDPASWAIRPSQATSTLVDGDRIDLGGRILTVLHAPGHSPDGICLLEEREGLLFGADTINAGPIYAQFADSDVDTLAQSTRRLADLRDEVRLIMVHHFGRVISDSGFLPEIAEGLESVQSGDATLWSARDILDTPILEARFDHFSVALPDPEAEQPALTGSDSGGS